MKLRIIGDPPLARQPDGSLKNHLGTVFPDDGALITGRGIHATLKLHYLEQLQAERRAEGRPPLTPDDERARQERAVDLVMREDTVFIRPEVERMDLAFAADELLQQAVPKTHIRFLGVLDEQVRKAIKRRGECWRINALPHTADDMKRMVRAARTAIGTRVMYYHNMETGTRFLTCHEFARLEGLPADHLAAGLEEIKTYAARQNHRDYPEVAFFKAGPAFGPGAFQGHDFALATEARLREVYRALKEAFSAAVEPEFRTDDCDALPWRLAMFMALMAPSSDKLPEEVLLGLSPEFHLRVQWLPGARLEEGELIYDSVYDEPAAPDDKGEGLCDEKVRSFIFNLLREHNYQVEYVNIACVTESLSQRSRREGRRGVYVAELRETGKEKETVKLIRMQKWDVREHLVEGKDLLRAMRESEEYTEYVLDRHFGCKQLGMALLPIQSATVTERWNGQLLRSTYFQRDYAYGFATDKIPPSRYASPEFSLRLARLLGEGAAPNLVVGRATVDGKVLYDDGDEIVVPDDQGLPSRVIVADSSGSFADYTSDLERFVPAYAEVVARRVGQVPDLQAFAELYVAAFVERLEHLQEQYHLRQRAFRSLFHHRRYDEQGCFAFRWEKVLDRLDRARPRKLGEAIRERLRGRV